MRTSWNFTPGQPGATRNIVSWQVANQAQDTYRIDVSWPLAWSTSEVSDIANVIYLVDGNAMFLSATESVRRRESLSAGEPGTVIVGIGYPLTDFVFSPRRSLDLTPPCDHYTPPEGPDGEPRPEAYGGADKFLSFIVDVVRPFIASRVFPHVTFDRAALFGHSYGGLFALHALFTRPSAFDTYLAASPSIWWNDRFILSEADSFGEVVGETPCPPLRLSFGSLEQYPIRRRDEPMEKFLGRVRGATQRRMADNCKELHTQLLKSGNLRAIEIREYPDEDHGSVIAPALSGGISYFLDLRN